MRDGRVVVDRLAESARSWANWPKGAERKRLNAADAERLTPLRRFALLNATYPGSHAYDSARAQLAASLPQRPPRRCRGPFTGEQLSPMRGPSNCLNCARPAVTPYFALLLDGADHKTAM